MNKFPSLESVKGMRKLPKGMLKFIESKKFQLMYRYMTYYNAVVIIQRLRKKVAVLIITVEGVFLRFIEDPPIVAMIKAIRGAIGESIYELTLYGFFLEELTPAGTKELRNSLSELRVRDTIAMFANNIYVLQYNPETNVDKLLFSKQLYLREYDYDAVREKDIESALVNQITERFHYKLSEPEHLIGVDYRELTHVLEAHAKTIAELIIRVHKLEEELCEKRNNS